MFGLRELYQYARFTAFNKEARDFVDMGLGIEARAKRCHKYWSKHQELSKNFIRSSVETGGSISILGAGRLYDFPIELLNLFSVVNLIDADPSCLPSWKKLVKSNHIKYEIIDLTGVLRLWTTNLASFLINQRKTNIKNLELKIGEFLTELNLDHIETYDISSDNVVSLNLLSQIPIYWRDRFSRLVLNYTGIDSDNNGNFSPAIQEPLFNTFKILQEQHLRLLEQITKKNLILIYDANFCYYQKTHSEWLLEPAIYTELKINTKKFNLNKNNSWLWHISPQDIEHQDYGVINEVLAEHYSVI